MFQNKSLHKHFFLNLKNKIFYDNKSIHPQKDKQINLGYKEKNEQKKLLTIS